MAQTDTRQRLAAILVADVAGYSRLMGCDEQGTVVSLDAARGIFRSHIESRHGRVVDMAGDSVLAVFDTAGGAVSAALDIQRELQARADAMPTRAELQLYVGRYRLARDVLADVHWQGSELEIAVAGRESVYLPADKGVALKPWSKDEFELGTARADHLRFERDAHGRITGFTLNPGPWPIRAQRLPPG